MATNHDLKQKLNQKQLDEHSKKSLDELQANLKEVLELCTEEYGDELDALPHFVGIQQVEVGT